MRHLISLAIRLLLLGLILAALGAPFQAMAQAEVTRLTELAVELWPDYDRPSVLVLLTGALPEDAALPATLSIPYPAGAEIHAVASFNETGVLVSDVDYSAADGLLTLTTPSSRFRVEYYAPYTVNGNEYTFTFEWTSPLIIDEMTTVVQQPVAATDFRVTPAPTGSATRGDGLTYHTLAARPVAANEPVTVELAYTVEAPVLSAPSQELPGTTATASSGTSTATSVGLSLWWIAAAAGALALLAGAWYVGRQQGRKASRQRKPQPSRPAPKGGATTTPTKKPPVARYCHNCGQAAQPGDTFCRHCGAQLKST
jgi:hypothetical protein